MASKTWIGGVIGWFILGPLGALIGAGLGYYLENEGEDKESLNEKMRRAANGQAGAGPNGSSGGGRARSSRFTEGAQPRYSRQEEANRNSFLMAMLTLSSFIIKADGHIMHSEMEVVRQWLRATFGESAVGQGEGILRKLFEESTRKGIQQYRRDIRETCRLVSQHVDPSGRLQMLDFMVQIARADGNVDRTEIDALKDLARWMDMRTDEIDRLLSMDKDDLESAYKVMGVGPDVTDDELKRIYRKLALEHHPDRVAALGDDVRRAAEKKFQEINNAKERIWKARGMS
jgi:DnaJ like chaperone protein